MKKTLSLILAMVMVISLLPVAALAAQDENAFAGGGGHPDR